MEINVVFNREIEGYKEVLESLEKALINKNVEFKSFDIDKMDNYGDFVLVIGGDGTILKAARFFAKFDIPILGINLGRLGFLSQAGISEIETVVDSIIAGNYSVEERLMLVSGNDSALNDFVIKGCSPSRTSKFYLEINHKFVCDYIADGLIISTPTGSTAYGLSAGGPVIYPTLEALVIVPICPHTLNARPLVVPTGEEITVKTADKQLSASPDGGISKEVNEITIKLAPYKAKLAFLNNDSFYTVLRNKLHWGISPSAK